MFFRDSYILVLSASVNSSPVPWPLRPPDGAVTFLKIAGKSGVEMGMGVMVNFCGANLASSRPALLLSTHHHHLDLLLVPSEHIMQLWCLTTQTETIWRSGCDLTPLPIPPM